MLSTEITTTAKEAAGQRNGTITATFTWNANGTGLPAPPNVKVEMIGSANWSCTADASNTAITSSGSCSDSIPGNVKYLQQTGRGEKSEAPHPGGIPYGIPSPARFVDKSNSSFTVTNAVNATVTITTSAGSSTGYGIAATFSPKIHAQPYDFVRTNTNVVQSDGSLYFEYGWKSTSGKKPELTSCYWHERVTYPGNDPYVPPPPFTAPPGYDGYKNPTTLPGLGSAGGHMWETYVIDNQDVFASSAPYSSTTFSASQRYEFDDTDTGESNVLIPSTTGDNVATITRTIGGHPPLTAPWWYSCTKQGFTAWLQLN